MKKSTASKKEITIADVAGMIGSLDTRIGSVENNLMEKIDLLAQSTARGFAAVDERFDGVEEEFILVKKDLSSVKEDIVMIRRDQLDMGDRYVTRPEFDQLAGTVLRHLKGKPAHPKN